MLFSKLPRVNGVMSGNCGETQAGCSADGAEDGAGARPAGRSAGISRVQQGLSKCQGNRI